MARTTNSELGMLASQRVRDLNGGAEPVVEPGRDKLTVVALREIASGNLDVEAVRNEFIQSYKDTPSVEESEASLAVGSENPELRAFDAELDDAVVSETVAVAEEADDSDEAGSDE